MAELVYAEDLKSSDSDVIRVQIPSGVLRAGGNMIIRELLNQCNYDHIAELDMKNHGEWEDEYEYTFEHTKIFYHDFAQMLLSLTPNPAPSEFIFIGHKNHEDGVTDIYVEMCKKEEVKEKLKAMPDELNIPNDLVKMTSGQLKEIATGTFGLFPISYGYEFEKWENTLNTEVIIDNVKAVGIDQFVYSYLFESSFNGTEIEDQDERRDELKQGIDEVNDIRKMPEEEQEKHLFSFDEIINKWAEDCGWVPPTEEEQEKEDIQIWTDCIRTIQEKFSAFKSLKLSDVS